MMLSSGLLVVGVVVGVLVGGLLHTGTFQSRCPTPLIDMGREGGCVAELMINVQCVGPKSRLSPASPTRPLVSVQALGASGHAFHSRTR